MFWSTTIFSVSRASRRSNSVLSARRGLGRGSRVSVAAARAARLAACGGRRRGCSGASTGIRLARQRLGVARCPRAGRSSTVCAGGRLHRAGARRPGASPRRFDSSSVPYPLKNENSPPLGLARSRRTARAATRRDGRLGSAGRHRRAASPAGAPSTSRLGWRRRPAAVAPASAGGSARRALRAPRSKSRHTSRTVLLLTGRCPTANPVSSALSADHADRARNAARPLVDQRHGLAREHLRADAAGGADAAGDVAGGFLQRQRPQLAAQRDALLQLPQRLVVQQRP